MKSQKLGRESICRSDLVAGHSVVLLHILLAAALLLPGSRALAQAPVIESLSRNGELIASNVAPGTTAIVEWASSPTGPWSSTWWSSTWEGPGAVIADSNGRIVVDVPMFYRVRGFLPSAMILIPAGPFSMGDTFNEGQATELPVHTVNVSAFFMDQYEVTKAMWTEVHSWAITNNYDFFNTGSSKAADHPVHTVSWFDTTKWCNARSEKAGLTPVYYTDEELTAVRRAGGNAVIYASWGANGYRLPTEAEWEKAARGGVSGRRFPWGDIINQDLANYRSINTPVYDLGPDGYNAIGSVGGIDPATSPVGSFAANGYGLHDMAGNVTEWCWDLYSYAQYPHVSSSVSDPTGPTVGYERVSRGGHWAGGALALRCAGRIGPYPTSAGPQTGFRCVRGLIP